MGDTGRNCRSRFLLNGPIAVADTEVVVGAQAPVVMRSAARAVLRPAPVVRSAGSACSVAVLGSEPRRARQPGSIARLKKYALCAFFAI